MRPLPWQHVLHALIACGCEILSESDLHVRLIRGAAAIRQVPKTLLPSAIQRALIVGFGIEEWEYLLSLPKT